MTKRGANYAHCGQALPQFSPSILDKYTNVLTAVAGALPLMMEPPGAAVEGEASELGFFFAPAGAVRLGEPRRGAPGWASVIDVACSYGIAAFSDGSGELISVVQPLITAPLWFEYRPPPHPSSCCIPLKVCLRAARPAAIVAVYVSHVAQLLRVASKDKRQG